MTMLSGLRRTKRRLNTRVFKHVASRLGLIYLGYVDQRDDDHRLIRGLTVSPTHRDANYCVGTVQGYDIMLVERRDTLVHRDTSRHRYRWVIVSVDLRTARHMPQVFVGNNLRHDAFMAKYSRLVPVHSGMFGSPSASFSQQFTIYARPDHAVEVERMFRPELTAMMAEHFAHMSVEIVDGTILVYGEPSHLTAAMLERMVANGIWLAQLLDTPGLIAA